MGMYAPVVAAADFVVIEVGSLAVAAHATIASATGRTRQARGVRVAYNGECLSLTQTSRLLNFSRRVTTKRCSPAGLSHSTFTVPGAGRDKGDWEGDKPESKVKKIFLQNRRLDSVIKKFCSFQNRNMITNKSKGKYVGGYGESEGVEGAWSVSL